MNDSGCEDTVPTMVPVCKLPDESDASMRARLFTSLSQSFPHSQLYKALHGGEDINLNGGDNSEDDDDSLYGDHLSNSCFASLRMDRRDSDDFDDDLQSLEWLQSEDLLKNIGGEKLDKDEDDNEEQKENEDIKPDINALQAVTGQQPATIPYLPQKHVNSKPPYSFSCLIFMAVEASPQKRLPVKDIYNWILTQFPYFQNAPTGWKNSVRHNLSLNKCFKKVEKDKGQSIGKGSLWCIDPAYRPNLLQALRKTPYHPYHQLQMTSTQPHSCIQYHSLPGGDRIVLPLTQRPVPNTVSPHLFPFLSRRLAQTSIDVDNEMKDVAQTLVALKSSHKIGLTDSSAGEDIGPTWKHHKRSNSCNNTRRRSSSPVVVTDHPYDDHAYSSSRLLDDDLPSPSSSSSIDEEYDFGDAVLSYLLRHTGDTADELFKQLDCSELSFPISDHFFCPHNEESDYQSDMEWDSDDKDEVDGGDIQSHRKLKIDIQGEGSTSTTNRAHGSQDSEDDEQKKIHEGASALLNLAGLYRSNSSTSNSPDCLKERKKKERLGEKSKKSNKVVKASKKGKDKKQVFSPKAEGEGSRKRSVSKRKNAGSNGKYDNEDYSLIKVNRTPTKGRPPNPDKAAKSKLVKSSASHKDPAKIAGLKTKAKTSVKGASKATKKSMEKKKLKLSKTFGSSKKQAADLSVDKREDLPAGGKSMKSNKTKKLLSKKEGSQTAAGALRKSKALVDGMKGKTYNPASAIDQQVLSADHGSTQVQILNNNHVKVANVSMKTSDDTLGNDKQLSAHQTDSPKGDVCYQSPSNKGHVLTNANGGIISPAGDAPAALLAEAKGSDAKLAVIKPPRSVELGTSSVRLETSDNLNQVSSIKNGMNNKNSPPDLVSGLGMSHRSPHFTRFSKKKAALS